MSSTPNYSPVAGDNTAALNAAIASGPVSVPSGTIGIAGNLIVPSGAVLQGQGLGLTTLQKIPGSAVATMIENAGAVSDITISDLTIDASPNQSGQFYPIGLMNVSRLSVERVRIINAYGCAFWLNGPDPGVPPNGIQINSDITIRGCIIDGSAQIARNADLIVLGRVERFTFENNYVISSGANMLAIQFARYFKVRGNTFANAWRAVYVETSQHGSIGDNDIYGAGTPASQIGDAQMMGVWIADGNQSYPGGGYAGCQDISVRANRINNLSRGSGSTGIVGVLVSGPQNLPATSIEVLDNIISDLSGAGGTSFGVQVQGDVDGVTIARNYTRNLGMGFFPIGANYNGYNRMRNIALLDNEAAGTTWAMYSVNGAGTARNFSSIANKFPTPATGGTNTNSGGYDAGITTMPGFVGANNQGF